MTSLVLKIWSACGGDGRNTHHKNNHNYTTRKKCFTTSFMASPLSIPVAAPRRLALAARSLLIVTMMTIKTKMI